MRAHPTCIIKIDRFEKNVTARRQNGSFHPLSQVCTLSLPPISSLEDLYIFEDRGNQTCWQDDVENTLWLELLHPFTAVKNLHLCEKFVTRIAHTLQEHVGARTTEVLPCRLFSWRGFSRRDLSKKAQKSSLPQNLFAIVRPCSPDNLFLDCRSMPKHT